MNIKSSIGRSKNVSSVALGQYRCRSDIAVRIDCTRLQVPGRQIGGYCSECYNAYASQALPRARLYVTQPLGLCLSVYRQAPNRQQAPALVKWSWRPFWGCRRYDKSRPVAFPRRVGAPSKQVRDETAVDEPSLARAGRTRGARCLRLWSCVVAG